MFRSSRQSLHIDGAMECTHGWISARRYPGAVQLVEGWASSRGRPGGTEETQRPSAGRMYLSASALALVPLMALQ